MRTTRIPLFPLEVVLFPGMPLPLHIFEPRYRIMIAHCINEKIDFGVILATGTEIAKIGCTAEVVEKLKEYPDGRVDILCEGRLLFRPIEVLHEKEYQEAIADYLPEDIPLEDPQKEAELLERFQVCHALVFGQPWIVSSRDDQLSLAFQMAARLPLELEVKQNLLEIREEHARQAFLLLRINELMPLLAQRQRLRKIAGGNGHSVN
ncbi:MAG TPA: LON peptidase substrate-binding domain-containing protein [Candidatus Acidoferrales bacterium]|nr:LON peptidase substrate-binding domain-containing protein [Candidatus Acidoferrales bacterium]